MARLLWGLAAAVTGLLGWWMLLVDFGGWTAYLLLGVALGIVTSVVGSLAHDVLAGSRERL